MEKKFDGNYTRMLRAILSKSWRQHPTKQQLCSHLTPITKAIQVRRTSYEGHCGRNKDELINDILRWTPSHGRAKARRPVRTYIQKFCADTGCSLEDLPGAMDDRDGWRERVRKIRAGGVTWWWWGRIEKGTVARRREKERQTERRDRAIQNRRGINKKERKRISWGKGIDGM